MSEAQQMPSSVPVWYKIYTWLGRSVQTLRIYLWTPPVYARHIVASTNCSRRRKKVATTASPREITGEESDFINPVFWLIIVNVLYCQYELKGFIKWLWNASHKPLLFFHVLHIYCPSIFSPFHTFSAVESDYDYTFSLFSLPFCVSHYKCDWQFRNIRSPHPHSLPEWSEKEQDQTIRHITHYILHTG